MSWCCLALLILLPFFYLKIEQRLKSLLDSAYRFLSIGQFVQNHRIMWVVKLII